MGAAAVIGLILGNLPTLIQVVEMLVGIFKGTGSLKKEIVMSVVEKTVDTIAALPGNAETARQKEQIMGIASGATDAIVGGFNVLGWGNPATVGSDR